MKKLLAFLLAAFLLISLVACGPDDSADPEDPNKDDLGGDSQGSTPDASPDKPDNDPAVPDLDWGYPQ